MILYVVFIHGLSGVIFNNDPAALREAPRWLLLLFAPVALLATWAPLFAFVSGGAHAYGFHKIIRGNPESTGHQASLGRFLAGSVTTALILYVLSAANMAFMHHPMHFHEGFHYTLLTGWVLLGHVPDFSVDLLFYNDALSMIAGCGLAADLLLIVFYRMGWLSRAGRAVPVLCLSAAAVLLVTPALQRMLTADFFMALQSGDYARALAVKLTVGPNLAVFPCLAFTLVGAAVIFAVADGVPIRILLKWGWIGVTLLLVSAAMLFALEGYSAEELSKQPGPVRMQVLNLGLILGLSLWLLRHIDLETDPVKRSVWVSRTQWVRRAGVMALSIFCFESFFATCFSRVVLFALGWNAFPRTPWAAGPFLLFLVVFWIFVTWLFERVQFRWTLEWFMAQIVGKVRGWGTRRLDPAVVLRPESCLADSVEGNRT